MSDNRDRVIRFRATDDEYKDIESNSISSGYTTVSAYVRAVALEKLVVQFNPNIQKKMLSLMSNLTSNMNQVAIRVNEHRNIYQVDIDELKGKVEELCRLQVSILSELQKLKH
ncbi:MAG: hypothetical protein PUE12_01730 [Oscillospiraceae bacterium]|nr:hypothetical protein [Oscillospiraceae bacterium]